MFIPRGNFLMSINWLKVVPNFKRVSRGGNSTKSSDWLKSWVNIKCRNWEGNWITFGVWVVRHPLNSKYFKVWGRPFIFNNCSQWYLRCIKLGGKWNTSMDWLRVALLKSKCVNVGGNSLVFRGWLNEKPNFKCVNVGGSPFASMG